jgi:hypothetical protein
MDTPEPALSPSKGLDSKTCGSQPVLALNPRISRVAQKIGVIGANPF